MGDRNDLEAILRKVWNKGAANDASGLREIADELARLQPARVPKGYAIVPREPTGDMLDAMLAPWLRNGTNARSCLTRGWKGAIAAAPAPDSTNADDVERAAMAVAADWQGERESVVPWSELPEKSRELARAQVRVVLAAVGKLAPEADAKGVATHECAKCGWRGVPMLGIFCPRGEGGQGCGSAHLRAAHPAPEPTEAGQGDGIAQSAKAGQAVPRMAGATISGCGDVAGQSEPASVKQGEGREGVEALAITLAEDVRTALDRQSCPDHYMRIAYETVESAVIRRLSSAPQPDHSPGAGKMVARTGTVADISDEELLKRAVTSIAKQRGRQYAWARIMDVFMLGSTYSAQLCRRFDIDPDTGKTTQRTGSRGEGHPFDEQHKGLKWMHAQMHAQMRGEGE